MNNPFYYAVVWWSGDKQLIGTIIPLKEYQHNISQGYMLHSFTGRTATVCILSLDETITRDNKLDFAIMFMKGTYVTITVDLAKLTSKTEHGKPPPCY